MAIIFSSFDISFEVKNKRILKSWITKCIENYNFKLGDITILFCSDRHILKINKQFLKHNYFTDIITFPYIVNDRISADILISIDTVSTNAIKYNQTFSTELYRVIIHGILHLVGHNDSNSVEKSLMTHHENRWIEELKSYGIEV